MTVEWQTVEDVLTEWIVSATGIDAARVWWADQAIPRPDSASPWISVSVMGVDSPGQDWVTSEENPTPTPGRERIRRVQGTRVMPLSIQCFAGDATGAGNPKALLDNCRFAISLPDQLSAFTAAGVGIGNVSAVTTLSGVLNSTRFEPRATMTVDVMTIGEFIGYGTTIDRVELSIAEPVGDADDPVNHLLVFEVPPS